MFKHAASKVKVPSFKCNMPLCNFRNAPQPRPGKYNCSGCSRGTYKISDQDVMLIQSTVYQPYTYQQTAYDGLRIREDVLQRREETYQRKQQAGLEAEARRQELARARFVSPEPTRKADERRAKLWDRLAEDKTLGRRHALRRKPGSSDGYTSSSSSEHARVQTSSSKSSRFHVMNPTAPRLQTHAHISDRYNYPQAQSTRMVASRF
ncbi:hypothetical protein K435DRAFT_959821 [Dendrothele bispora CBS 962.96]|uniref:Uncharacterized protein n=1 Tax=Dendrothele bispora (strain CBS 962.96) TaxID=1314807 RepID=A0A4S8MVC2_DENBC|nr:hypothetical protein K435DRAFT_959821 [Dendrothele bispora CBS 962.96]